MNHPMNPLAIPDRLYGRERDLAALCAAFEHSSRGHGTVVLLPGCAGVGKTALVQKLRRPVRDKNGFFIQGKFDQYQQSTPYFAFRQALAEFARELQAEDEPQRARWKTEISEAIGNLGQLLVDLVPEFLSLLGAQPPLVDISPQEARHRFAGVVQNFLKVVCRPEHPLVLFMDDWQWADAASLALLKQLQIGGALRYLLVIVAYRDDEVDAGHPLLSTVDDLRRQAVPVEELRVKNLAVHDVQALVLDTLTPAPDASADLAAIIHATTMGNPFFVRALLNFMLDTKLIWRDDARHAWQWSRAALNKADLPGNVVELFVQKLSRLDSATRHLFSLAACLGNRFDLKTLRIISGYPPADCLALLATDQAHTMLRPLDDSGGASPAQQRRAPAAWMFLHDRIQQAAYSLIDPAELPHILLKIGRLLHANLPPDQLAERLFEVVGDLNAGYHLLQDPAEMLQVVGLNIMAARKAHAATAYRAALQFYRAAHRFLEQPTFAEQLWRAEHALAMRLFNGRAECEFLEGSRAEAEACVHTALAHATTAIEKADAISVLIVHYTLLAKYPEAIAAGRQALAALGISLPEDDYETARNAEIAQVRHALASRPVAALVDLPVMCQPEMLMAAKIMITMGPPCYRSHQRLWSVLVPKVVNLTLQHGNIPQVGYSHTAFGGLLGWVDDDYATAREFGELATRLMTGTFTAPTDQSVFYLMIGSSIRHWFQHLSHSTQDYTNAYEIGLHSGNLQYAAYAFGHNLYCRFYQGVPLATLRQEAQRALDFSRTRVNQWAIDLLEGGLHVFDAVAGVQETAAWSEEDYLQRVADHHNIQVTCIYNVLQTCAQLLLGKHARALKLSDTAEPLIYTVGTQGLLPWPEHVFARLLILTALYPKAKRAQQTKWRPELDRLLGKLRIWAANCPDNFAHKYLLATAELARIDGRPGEAMPLYDQAVAAAHAGNFLQWEALANERAYHFWLACGHARLAQVYWQQAYACYDRWGAAAKVAEMEQAYRADLADLLPGAGAAGPPAARALTKALLDNQINQLRACSFQMQEASLRAAAAIQAEELAQATERLRVQVAERKHAEEAQQNTNMQLRESVAKRELALQALHTHQVELELQNTELRQAQAELDAVRARYFDLYNLAPVGYVTVSEHGVILEANLTAATLLGMPRGTLVTQRLSRFICKDQQDAYYQYRKQLLATAAPQAFELRMLKKDGTPFWGRLDTSIAQDAVGARVLRVVLSDITTRMQAEEVLHESETRFDQLAELSGTVVWEVDALGLFTYVSHVAEQVYGYQPAELAGTKYIYDLHPEAGRAAFKSAVFSVSGRKDLFHNLENAVQTKDGRQVWVLTNASPLLHADGSLRGYRGSDTDITTRKQTEAEQQKMQKLQSIGTLAGGIAHDFNNILMSLFGNISLAKTELAKEHPGYSLLEEAETSMSRAVRLTKQLLTFAKGGEPIKEDISLGALVEDIARFDLSGSKVKLVYHQAEHLWLVEADKGQIQQVVSNLVINARQAMPKGGCLYITIENAVITPGAMPNVLPGNYVKVRVRDEGTGIDPKYIDRIFDPYFTTKQEGNGLGLATAYSVIHKHGGHIGIASELGKGTTFTLLLPAAAAAQPAATTPPAAASPAANHPARILVMDDEKTICFIVARMLQSCGFTVATANDGQQALTLYQQARAAGAPFDVVIMDLTVPGGMGGADAIKDLLVLDPLARAIVSSGYADDPVMANYADYGFKGIAAKPYTLNDLREVLARVLQG